MNSLDPHDDTFAQLQLAHRQIQTQLQRQNENHEKLSKTAADMKICYQVTVDAQEHPDIQHRLKMVKIAVKHLTQINNRTSNYAAALQAGMEGLQVELKEHEKPIPPSEA